MNKSALVAVPIMLLVVAVFLNRDRIKAPDSVLIAGFIVLVIAVVAIAIRLAIRRERSLAAVAGKMGLQFASVGNADVFHAFHSSVTPEDEAAIFDEAISGLGVQDAKMRAMLQAGFANAQKDEGIGRTELRQLKLIHGKNHPLAKNVMSGALNGLDALIFDYSYRSGPRTNSYWITQTVAAFRCPGRTFAAFELAPQTILDSVGALVGFRDINFDDQPDFSRKFLLRGSSESDVRALFTPRVLHAFDRLDDGFDFTVEGAGECLIVYKPNREVAPDRIQSFAQQASSVAAALRG